MQIKKVNDTWQIRFKYFDSTNNYQEIKRRFKTKKECTDFYGVFLKGLETESLIGKRLLVSTYLQQWLDRVESELSPSTFQRYRIMVEKTITPHLGNLKMADVKAYHIDDLLNKVRKSGLSQTTVKHCYRTLFTAFKKAWQMDIVADNVVAKLDTPKTTKKELNVMSLYDQKRFLNQLDTDFKKNNREGLLQANQNKAFFILALETGMRRGELASLKWSDINFNEKRLFVRRNAVCSNYNNSKITFKLPKNNKVRVIDLDSTTLMHLKNYKAFISRYVLDNNLQSLVTDEWVFPSFKDSIEQLVAPNLWTNRYKSICERAGISGIRLHDLRHTHISNLLNIRPAINMKYISQRAGHSTISTTVDIYGHLIPDMNEGIIQESAEYIAQKRLQA